MTSSNGSSQVANTYNRAGRYDKAKQLYQYVIDNWSKTEQAMWAKVGIARLNISLGNDAAVGADVNNLIADFSSHLGLSQALFQVGEQYYNTAFEKENEGRDEQAKDGFRKAIAVWEKIISRLSESDSTVTAHAYYFSAECYRKLAQHSKAIDYYQKVVNDWPRYQYAWNALFLVGQTYETLGESGIISKSEANLKTKAAYEQLIREYPDCLAANIAQRWLTRHK